MRCKDNGNAIENSEQDRQKSTKMKITSTKTIIILWQITCKGMAMQMQCVGVHCVGDRTRYRQDPVHDQEAVPWRLAVGRGAILLETSNSKHCVSLTNQNLVNNPMKSKITTTCLNSTNLVLLTPGIPLVVKNTNSRSPLELRAKHFKSWNRIWPSLAVNVKFEVG